MCYKVYLAKARETSGRLSTTCTASCINCGLNMAFIPLFYFIVATMLVPLSVVMAKILSSGNLQFLSISCNFLAILVPVWDSGRKFQRF